MLPSSMTLEVLLPFGVFADLAGVTRIVSETSQGSRGLLPGRLGWLAVICGQNSLEIFCLSILLSVLANMAQTLYGTALPTQIVINFTGIVIMLNFGLLLAWFDGGGKLPVRPLPTTGLPPGGTP